MKKVRKSSLYTPSRRMWKLRYNSTHSYPWHSIEPRGYVHATAALWPGNDSTVPTEQEARCASGVL
jgi:hypothetical protein